MNMTAKVTKELNLKVLMMIEENPQKIIKRQLNIKNLVQEMTG